jgi:hypothetical protein
VRNDLVVLVLATAASYPLGLALGHPWILPALNTLPAYLVLVHRRRKGERGGAVRAMLWWAATLAIAGTTSFVLWPAPVGGSVLWGPAYQAQMLSWVRTGHGIEGSLRLFLPRQLLLLGGFVVLSLATASALSSLAGAVLLNEMSFYVASLAKAGVPGWAVALLGWSPWTIARGAAFCTLGVVLAEPLLFRLFPGARHKLKVVGRMPYYVAALSGFLADWFLRAGFAAFWAHWLRSLLR